MEISLFYNELGKDDQRYHLIFIYTIYIFKGQLLKSAVGTTPIAYPNIFVQC